MYGSPKCSMFNCSMPECNRKYKLESKLAYHLENDHKSQCDQCDASFKNELQLQKHKDSRHSNIIYSCNMCDTICNSEKQLQRHVNNKHNRVFYDCKAQGCSKKYRTLERLEQHYDKTHNNNTFYNCTEQGCLAKYMTQERLQEHINKVHTNIVYETGDIVVHPSKEDYCCICMENESNMAIVPCGHKCLCERCQLLLDKSRGCPICRSEITSYLKIYS